MKFEYISSKTGFKKELREELIEEIRVHLEEKLPLSPRMYTLGDVNDVLLEFKSLSGNKLMINQLHPIFLYLVHQGRIWDKEN